MDKVSNLKASIIGDGQVSCLVCGTKKGPLKPCNVCSRVSIQCMSPYGYSLWYNISNIFLPFDA